MMPTQIGFYHLTQSSIEEALPRLLNKGLASKSRFVVMAGSDERVDYLDQLLWTCDAASWLPHGTANDEWPEHQPIFITMSDENPNGAVFLILIDGAETKKIGEFSRCFNLFDGKDPVAVQQARKQWSQWSTQGYILTYYQQTDLGGWQEKTTINQEKIEVVDVHDTGS